MGKCGFELSFEMVSGFGQRYRVFDGMHIGATSQIQLNDCARRL